MNHLQQHTQDPKLYNMVSYQYALHNCMRESEMEERGQKYRSWDAAHVVFDSNQSMLFNFADRKLNVRYAMEEFLWYCRGDKFDTTIERHANAWKKLSQPDGSFFSNYGHYIFSKMGEDGVSMFRFAAEELMRNPSTRRAAFPLLETKHCFHQNVDMVCTFGIQFFIRGTRLVMVVNMRSNDAVWGLTNDAFAFSMLHRLMFVVLRDGIYNDNPGGGGYSNLLLGEYHHIANTLHVYERHYDMAEKIIEADVRNVGLIDVPMFTTEEAQHLLSRDAVGIPSWSQFLR